MGSETGLGEAVGHFRFLELLGDFFEIALHQGC